MAKVSISQAAKLARMSRSSLYNYIDAGKITTSKDERDKPYIETSELIRVFGTLHDEGELIAHPLADANAQDNTPNTDLKSLEQQLQKAKEREHTLTAEFAQRNCQ